jgi:hypothetical protein
VIMSQSGGSIRESFSMAKSYTEARKQHGQSQLLDDITAAKPEVDRTRKSSGEELKQHNLQIVRDALALLDGKATAEEVEQYKQFILTLGTHVAEAHREGFLGLSGERVSDAERAALAEIAELLGLPAPEA